MPQPTARSISSATAPNVARFNRCAASVLSHGFLSVSRNGSSALIVPIICNTSRLQKFLFHSITGGVREVVYAAAHAEFPDSEPLGGGKAVADYLIREWPGPLTVLSPARFGIAGKLTEMSERQYAHFCRQFERMTTREILKRDPRRCVVLCNDISEGPDFV